MVNLSNSTIKIGCSKQAVITLTFQLKNNLQSLTYDLGYQILTVTARDKSNNKIKIYFSNTTFYLELKTNDEVSTKQIEVECVVNLNIDYIGSISSIRIFPMGITKIILKSYPYFNFSGIGRYEKKDGLITLTESVTDKIPNQRLIHLEFSKEKNPKFFIDFEFQISHKDKTYVKEFCTYLPQDYGNKHMRQSSSLDKISGINDYQMQMQLDENNNKYLKLSNFELEGSQTKLVISTRVVLESCLKTQVDKTNLGAMQIVYHLTENSILKKYIQDVPGQFELNHPKLRAIESILNKQEKVFNRHLYAFEYTNRGLEYKITEGRKSSSWTLDNMKGDCSEFSDLLITLHRLALIPSRSVSGFVLDINERADLSLHAWVEFFAKDCWNECDPTWGIPIGISSKLIRLHTSDHRKSPGNVRWTTSKGQIYDLKQMLKWLR